MENSSTAQRVANRLFAAEAATDRAIAKSSELLAETLSVQSQSRSSAGGMTKAVAAVEKAVTTLMDARRALDSTGFATAVHGSTTEQAPSGLHVWRPQRSFDSAAEVDLPEVEGKQFGIIIDTLMYACELTRLPEADRLYVTLHAFADRRAHHPPYFWGERRLYDNGHVLRISDPTLFLNEEITISGFLGTDRHDPVEGVVEIAQQVAHKLGLRNEQIIYWGTSGGGFGALRAATLTRNGRAIAVNTQMESAAFEGAPWARPIRETFKAGWSFAEITEAYPIRASVTRAMQFALRRGFDPRLMIVQNDADTMCYADHFVPFCQAFGLDPARSSQTANIKTLVYHNWRGHAVVPRGVSMRVASEGQPFLLGEQTVSGPLNVSWWDEAYYLRHNPDVAEAVRKGRLRSGLEHYQLFGAHEKRRYRPIGPE